MNRRIEKAVVLGAGTMGSRIAAHFANAGLPCILLDMVPPNLPVDASAGERNKIVRAGFDAAKKSKPAAFFIATLAEKIAIGNFEDDLRPIVKLAAERCGQETLIQQKQAAGVLVPIYDLQAAKIKESFPGVEVLQDLNLDALGQASIR